jgi:hypothetical protein
MNTPLRFLGLVMLCVGLGGPALAEEDPPRIAVLELSGELDSKVLQVLSDKVRAGVLAGTAGRRLVVMTRENMAVIAGDMGVDLSCVEGECEVQTARNLGADLVISGSVVQIGGLWLCTLKLHETDRGGLIGTSEARSETPIGLVDQLAGVVETMTRDKLGPAQLGDVVFGGVVRSAPPGTRTVLVSFGSKPAGAVVHVDGQLECNSTPCTSEVPVGQRQVVFSMAQHRSDARVIEIEGNGQAVQGELKPRFAEVAVRATVPVEFTIDGEASGHTNRTVRMDPGTHRVQIDDRCFVPTGVELTVSEGESRALVLSAERRMVPLEVRALGPTGEPIVADVFLDNRPAGNTIFSEQVWACHKRVMVKKKGLKSSSAVLRLKEEDNKVSLTLTSLRRPTPPRRAMPAVRAKRGRSAGHVAGSLGLTTLGIGGWGCGLYMYMEASDLHDKYERAKNTEDAQARYVAANTRQLIGHGCMVAGTIPGLMGLSRLTSTSHTPMLRTGGRF